MSFLLFQNFKNSSTFEKFELSNFSITGSTVFEELLVINLKLSDKTFSKSDSDDKAEFEKNSIIKSLGIILKKKFIMQITTEPYHSAL